MLVIKDLLRLRRIWLVVVRILSLEKVSLKLADLRLLVRNVMNHDELIISFVDVLDVKEIQGYTQFYLIHGR